MASLNKVMLIGNLTKDPELRYTPSGIAVANIRIAVNRKYKDKSGENKEEVCYITVTTWDKQAEVCNQYLKKGRPIFVEGRLQSRSWETTDGQKKSTIEIRAERIQFLGGREGAPSPSPSPSLPSHTSDEAAADHLGPVASDIKPETVSWDEEENVGQT